MELKIEKNDYSFEMSKSIIDEFQKRVISSPPYACSVEMSLAFLKLCHAQSCGKCVPCREGIKNLIIYVDNLLKGNANENILNDIKYIAYSIKDGSDCAIGKEAAKVFLDIYDRFYNDFNNHAVKKECLLPYEQPIPCVSMCPAHVDIPGYIALVHEKKFKEAIQLIRKDNPFPTACGLICEHPCENRCRRKMLDDAVNIRGIKRYAVDMCHADTVPIKKLYDNTNKKIAIIGGGPSGLTCAYYLSIMGHNVTLYEEKKKLGGMMRYGIPAYRFPRERLDEDINAILSLGIDVKCNIKIGKDMSFNEIKNNFDAVYVAIGAHIDKKISLDGEDAKNVIPAVDVLRDIGDEKYPDYTDKNVIVIGGGNVAMDVARTSIRCHAKTVRLVYRRRVEDMTALREEIISAMEEGVIIESLKAPHKIINGNNGEVVGLEVKQIMCSTVDNKGRFGVKEIKNAENITYNADVIIIATGQDVDSKDFANKGFNINRNLFVTNDYTNCDCDEKIFAGGDCVFGPSTVIKAIQAGKVASRAIDKFLGYNHKISYDIDIPKNTIKNDIRCARVDMVERDPIERIKDFNQSEILMCEEEMLQESNRCLRCDKKGCSTFRGGRELSW